MSVRWEKAQQVYMAAKCNLSLLQEKNRCLLLAQIRIRSPITRTSQRNGPVEARCLGCYSHFVKDERRMYLSVPPSHDTCQKIWSLVHLVKGDRCSPTRSIHPSLVFIPEAGNASLPRQGHSSSRYDSVKAIISVLRTMQVCTELKNQIQYGNTNKGFPNHHNSSSIKGEDQLYWGR